MQISARVKMHALARRGFPSIFPSSTTCSTCVDEKTVADFWHFMYIMDMDMKNKTDNNTRIKIIISIVSRVVFGKIITTILWSAGSFSSKFLRHVIFPS